jgi:hypothetical protein
MIIFLFQYVGECFAGLGFQGRRRVCAVDEPEIGCLPPFGKGAADHENGDKCDLKSCLKTDQPLLLAVYVRWRTKTSRHLCGAERVAAPFLKGLITNRGAGSLQKNHLFWRHHATVIVTGGSHRFCRAYSGVVIAAFWLYPLPKAGETDGRNHSGPARTGQFSRKG